MSSPTSTIPDGEPVDPAPKPTRRTFTAEYRNKIIDEYNKAAHGEKSAVLRREGLHQSQLREWTLTRNAKADKRLLLVLDNCEHLVEVTAEISRTLLQTCPGLQILATSRERLSIAGETTIRVPSMSVPHLDRAVPLEGLRQYESVNLFTDRAVEAVPDFELTDDNKDAVAQICQRLDGLPLAIELAAVRLRAMSVQQLLDRLTDRYRLLTSGNRAAPSRQQTLRLSIDWSYELCTRQEKQLWTYLVVFAGSFDLDAVEAVCAGDLSSTDLLDLVASLVDKSILIRVDGGEVVRYRLLETLRDYGREKLQTKDRYEVLQRRHRDWYEQLVLHAEADWISPRQLKWITRLEQERFNVHRALRFCLSDANGPYAGMRIAAALLPFWLSRGLLSEGRLWLERVLAIRADEPTVDRAKALYMASVLAAMHGEIQVGSALLAEGHDICNSLENTSMYSSAGYAAGCISLYSHEPSRAIACFEKAIAGGREIEYTFCQIGSLLGIGLACMLQDHPADAVIWHETIRNVTERHGELVYRGRSSTSGGWGIWREGDPGRATAVLEQGLRLSRQVDDPVGFARSVQVLAWIKADRHHEDQAAVLLGATAGIWRDIGGLMASFLDGLTYQHQCERRVRSRLGDRKTQELMRKGRDMSIDEVAAYALGASRRAVRTQPDNIASSLTRRERQVADLVAEGLTNRMIASRLVISHRTAQGHVEHILSKLGFTSRSQIAAWVVSQVHNLNTD
ncbi:MULTISPECIES: ATP-binding protein [Rhodococcus]|uniref:ATP-binding protein n=2 Tax=Nocardiaceae TaxID=85025 RepID=UPI0006BB5163|nr:MULTISPECIES: LuxR C-terminal-related transcriptional regulator [Rhodococcus]QHE73825.1 hypothetical protein GFS60_07494 [Rhodococcus sp. WAY2]